MQDGASRTFLFKFLFVGDSSVGKSSILNRFASNTFEEQYISTIGVDFVTREMEIKGQTVKLQIWDTAGQERFRTITANYYRGAHGIVVVYDITNATTFQNVRGWLDEMTKHACENVNRMILGNKKDLADRRQVSTEAGEEYADSVGVPFFETSAKSPNDEAIPTAFRSLAEAVLERVGDRAPAAAGRNATKLQPGQHGSTYTARARDACC